MSSPLPESMAACAAVGTERGGHAGAAAGAFPPRGPAHDRVLLAVAALRLALELPSLPHYGWFRDEFYYVACSRHLAWGFVDQPPLSIALLALWRLVVHDSLFGMRLLPAVVGAATVFLAGRIAREFGGGRWAQALAAFAIALAPLDLGLTQYYSMNAFDGMFWAASQLVFARLLRESTPRRWAGLGLLLGLGLMNKISVLWLIGGLAAGLVATHHRRLLATRGPWIAAAIAAVIFAPNVAWQVANHWPTIEFMRNATGIKMVAIAPLVFMINQVLSMGPLSAPLWLWGLFSALFGAARAGRPFAIAYLAMLALFIVGGHARVEYLALAYPALYALGAVRLEAACAHGWRRHVRPAFAAAIALGGLLLLPFALPLLPVPAFVRYEQALGLAPKSEEHIHLAELPQHYADMFGWDDMVALVAKAYARLSPAERAHTAVFGQNYGEAGAVDVLGRKLGLPPAISAHNNYGLWGPGPWQGGALIVIGGDRKDNAAVFDSLEIVGQTASPWAIPYERGLDVSIGRGLKVPVKELWGRLVHFM